MTHTTGAGGRRIGMTYDLRADYLALGYGEEETAEFDRISTVEALEKAIADAGHTPVRIGNVRALVAALGRGETWDAVLNVCEGLSGFGREAQVPAILDAFGLSYTFADPLTACVTLHKGTAKRVLRDAGVPTTDFAIVASAADAERVSMPFPLFVKPVAEGTAKGIHPTSRVLDREQLVAVSLALIDRYHQPVIVEPFLPGREFTTAIRGEGAGAEVIGTMEVVLLEGRAESHAYTYLNKEESEERCVFPMVEGDDARRCGEVALAAWRALGCRDAGRVDLREDGNGQLMVMEANPLPGMHPEHSDLPMICTASGMPYGELVRFLVEAALSRAR